MSFHNLSVEVLCLAFKYCHIDDLMSLRRVCRHLDEVVMFNFLHITDYTPADVGVSFTSRFLVEQMKRDPASNAQIADAVAEIKSLSTVTEVVRTQITAARCRQTISVALIMHNGQRWVFDSLRDMKNDHDPCYLLKGEFLLVLVAWLNLGELSFYELERERGYTNRRHERLGSALYAATYNDYESLTRCLVMWCVVIPREGAYGDAYQLAAYRGSDKVLEMLLARYKPDDGKMYRYGPFKSPIGAAAAKGHVNAVRLLIRWKLTGVVVRYPFKQTPLFLAVNRGHIGVVELLLKEGIEDPRSIDTFGYTPLSLAVRRGHETLVKFLLKFHELYPGCRKICPNQGMRGQLPLQVAVQRRLSGMAKLLLGRYDTDPNCQNEKGGTPLMIAIESNQMEIVRCLLSDHRTVQVFRNHEGMTYLMHAAWQRISNTMQPRAAMPTNLNLKTNDGRTALHIAVQKGTKESIDLLLSRNDIDPNAQDIYLSSALHYAACYGCFPAVQSLLSHPSTNPNLLDKQMMTPLYIAVAEGHVEIVRLMIKHSNTNVNCQCSTRASTPLIRAVRENNTEMIQVLLTSSRVDKDVQDYRGDTALTIAASSRRTVIAQLLLQSPLPNLDLTTLDGMSALQLAIEAGSTEIRRLLINHGAEARLPPDDV